MEVLVDTPVWSLALRRSPGALNPEQARWKQALAELIEEGRVELIGPIRQELLSGLREERQFERLRQRLRAFDDVRLTTEDYEQAARIHNQCRAAGISGSSIDFLICAVALQRRWQIMTLDKDFREYARRIPLALFTPRESRP